MLEGASTREEHDRARARRGAALELVHAPGGVVVVGVAADAVDGVGGEHGDAPGRHALLQAQCVLAGQASGAHARHPFAPRRTRSIPARSRSRRTDGKPLRAAAPRPRAPGRPHLQGGEAHARRARASWAASAADRAQPVRLRRTGPSCGSWRRSRGRASALALGDVGKVGQNGLEPVGDAREQVRLQPADVEPQARGVRAGQLERALAEVAAADPRSARSSRAPARPRRSRCRRRAPASRAGSASADSTRCSVSGRGIRARRSTASSSRRKPRRPTM